MLRLITLPCYGIKMRVGAGFGFISSELHETIQKDLDKPDYDGPESQQHKETFNSMMDGIESMVLAHAVAEIDVEDPRYLQGIEDAVHACSNQ